MKYRIGIMGTAGRGKKLPEKLLEKARCAGKEIAKQNCILITGACMGIPNEAEKAAAEEKGIIIGFSPADNLKEHLEPPIRYPLPPENSVLIFTGMGKEGRNLLSIRNCDGVIFIGGHAGTLLEFSLAYHMGKVIGAIEVEGISAEIPQIANKIKKNTGAVIISDKEPKRLVEKIIEVLKEREVKIWKE